MTDTKDINPIYVDGEPLCTGVKCPAWTEHDSGGAFACMADRILTIRVGHPYDCVPALRRDRDRFRVALALSEHVRDQEEKRREAVKYPEDEDEDDVVVHLCAAVKEIERLRARKDDPARVERIAIVLLDNFGGLGDFNWDKLDEAVKEEWREQARDVLAAADAEE